ncbi:hypothetical protein C8046_13950 [Serinibacter arcticus]|uniref:SGNH hydrolase-type esterase domain-containing protein n=1 Tax=Serinibacter arcticus TaxID=1655435 RepID=A0A2U1ZX78_9MICO|nr:GDSL-type esterase/lipase family protein [Serinibacter arcticus]PWD51581.1 hypothetical protein C8046_13950 [Serinibacter arcticus]
MITRPGPRAATLGLTAVVLATAMLTSCSPADGGGEPTATGEAPPSSTTAPSSPTPTAAPEPAPAAGQPLVLLAVGDSLTTGFASCDTVIGCTAASWALGTDPAVDSIATRLGAAGYAVTSVDAALEGAQMHDGVALVDEALAQPGAPAGTDVGLVTVMFGANDVCAPDAASMTARGDFADALDGLLTHLETVTPGADVVVTSVPAVIDVWDAAEDDPAARQVWSYGLCETVLGGDDAVRAQAAERLAELQAAIAPACERHAACRFDDGAVAAAPVTAEWLSPVDHFHPSATGQAVLAAAAWPTVADVLGLDATTDTATE